jgi:hypothetical protein
MGNSHSNPEDFYEEKDQKRRKRQGLLVNRVKGFHPRITEKMMRADSRLRNLIPTGFDDLYAIYLQPGQAHYLNDYIREHNLEALQGSATLKWYEEKVPGIVVQALLTFDEKTKEGQLVEGV